MTRYRQALWFALLVVPISAANSADLYHYTAMPAAGAAGRFSGPALDTGELVTGVRAKTFATAVAGYKGSGEILRGGAEASLYARISPSVVLIFTDTGLGTGSLISADGQVLTNYHVVEGFTKVGVLFKPAKEGDKPSPSNAILADVLKVDPQSDLALLKLHSVPPSLQPIAFGDFNKVQVGDDVDAIGHPEGESWTFTRGYVSQIRRKYEWKNEDGKAHQADVIQTQTPINPGNSGGPLLSNGGQLIGVNAFKASDAEGLNFAIGVDTVQAFIASKGLTPAAAAAKETKCQSKILFEGRDKNNDGAVRQIDLLCHGKVNLAIVLPDDKSLPMVALIDMDETGNPQGMVLSNKRDGHWDISYWDTKGTGKWDTIGHHPDGKIVPSSYEPYTDDSSK